MTENELVRLYGGNTLIQDTVESACNSTGSCGTAEETGRICRNKQSLLRYVVQRAQELGTWIEIDDILGEMIGYQKSIPLGMLFFFIFLSPFIFLLNFAVEIPDRRKSPHLKALKRK